MAYSKTAFTGAASAVFWKATRVSKWALSSAVVAVWDSMLEGMSPTARGSGEVMMQGGGRWGVGEKATAVGDWMVGFSHSGPRYCSIPIIVP